MTITLQIQLDTFGRVNPERLAKAVYRAIDHAMESDIEGSEILNHDRIGQVSVKVDTRKENV